MDAVMEAVAGDFQEWLRIAKNQSTSEDTYSREDHRVNVKEFLYEFFSISHSFNISLDEIVTAFSSPDPSGYDSKTCHHYYHKIYFLYRSLTMNTITDTLVSCSEGEMQFKITLFIQLLFYAYIFSLHAATQNAENSASGIFTFQDYYYI